MHAVAERCLLPPDLWQLDEQSALDLKAQGCRRGDCHGALHSRGTHANLGGSPCRCWGGLRDGWWSDCWHYCAFLHRSPVVDHHQVLDGAEINRSGRRGFRCVAPCNSAAFLSHHIVDVPCPRRIAPGEVLGRNNDVGTSAEADQLKFAVLRSAESKSPYSVDQSRITFPDFPDPMIWNPCRYSWTGK